MTACRRVATKDIFHHEGREEHDVRSINYPKPSCPS
jgi:hypothetical protein